MISIDGSTGEGGGQIFRSSIGLSALTQTPVRIFNIRGKRRKDGLLRQHLTALRAMKTITNAKVEGDELRSTEVIFSPKKINGGDYSFEIGTAGSTSLVLQTILWPLFYAEQESRVEITGGTHNPMSPPFEFLNECFFPAIRELGFNAEIEIERYGFAPVGGGKIIANITPVKEVKAVEFSNTLDPQNIILSILGHGLPKHVAANEKEVFEEELTDYPTEIQIKNVQSQGSGNVVIANVPNTPFPFVAVQFGERGNAAAKVAMKLVRDIKHQIDSGTPVGPHLADQLIIPFSLAKGGMFETCGLTPHTMTQIEMVKLFTKTDIEVEKVNKRHHRITFQNPE